MGLNSNNSSIVSSGSQKLRDIFTVRNVKNGVGAAVLFLLSACGTEKQKLPHVEKPVDPTVNPPAAVLKAGQNLTANKMTVSGDGKELVVNLASGDKLKESELKAFLNSVGVKIDGVVTGCESKEIQLSSLSMSVQNLINKTPESNINILTTLVTQLGIEKNPGAVTVLLNNLGVKDQNADAKLDGADVLKFSGNIDSPALQVAYDAFCKNTQTGTGSEVALEASRQIFASQNMVQATTVSGDVGVITLTPSSADTEIFVKLTKEQKLPEEIPSVQGYGISAQNVIDLPLGQFVRYNGGALRIPSGTKLEYYERKSIGGKTVQSQTNSYTNTKTIDGVKTQFTFDEDAVKQSLLLSSQFTSVQILNLNSLKLGTYQIVGNTIEFTPSQDINSDLAGGDDILQVTAKIGEVPYNFSVVVKLNPVTDPLEAKDPNIGKLAFNDKKTFQPSDFVINKDGGKVSFDGTPATSNGATVFLNSDGTLTLVGDKEGAGTLNVTVTDGKTKIDVKAVFTTDAEPLQTSALESKIKEAEAINLEKYTPSSAKVLTDAITKAKEVLANPENQAKIDAAIKALDDAIKGLKELANKETLKNLITVAEGFLAQRDDYTKGSFASFETKLTAAKALVENKDVTPEDVKKAEDDLTAAVDALVSIKDLKALIASLPTNSALYTPASWTALQTAKDSANAVIGNDNASKDAVNTAISNLTNAKTALVLVGNKTALNNLIASLPTVSSNYTSGSWDTLQNVKNTVTTTVIENPNATQDEIDAAVASLQAAINALVNIVALNNAIISSPTDPNLYTPASWAIFQTALDNAKTVKNKANATQSEVNNAVTQLQNAISQLLFKGNKTTLTNLIDSLVNLVQSHYSIGSWTTLQNVKNTINTNVIQNPNATQAEIDAAITNLQNAKDALVNIQGLKALIDSLPSPTTESDYTPASWTALQTAKDAAILIRDKANATQDDVNTAITNLQTAKNGLVFVGNKTTLTSLIITVNGLTQDHFTLGSWNTLQTVKNAAVAVRDNVNASQDDVNTAVTNLQNAQNALVNIQGLKTAITSAASHTVPENYTSSSWTAFETSLNTANSVLANDNATAGQVTAATGDLLIKTTNLVSIQTLKATIIQAESKIQSDYTTSSWSALQTAKDAAILIRNKADATQSEVNTANTNLQNAIDNLVEGIAPTISNFVISDADGGAVAGYTNNRTINISITATDNVAVDGYYISESLTPPNDGQYVATAPTTFELSAGDGTKTVYLWVKDEAGNVSALLSRTITLDTVAPSSVVWDNGTPSEQGTTYTDMKVRFNESVQSFGLNAGHVDGPFPNGGTASGFSVNATNKNIVDIASLTTPNNSTYRINGTVVDLAGNSASATIVASGLEAPNQAPTANNFPIDAGNNGEVDVDFTSAVDDDRDGDNLILEIVSTEGVTYGSLADISNVKFTGIPGYPFGTSTVTYRVQDQNGLYSEAKTLTINNISN